MSDEIVVNGQLPDKDFVVSSEVATSQFRWMDKASGEAVIQQKFIIAEGMSHREEWRELPRVTEPREAAA